MTRRDEVSPLGGWRPVGRARGSTGGPGLRTDRRAAVPLRIAPLVVVGLIFVVLAVIAVTTL